MLVPRAAPRRRPADLRAAVGRLHPLPLHAAATRRSLAALGKVVRHRLRPRPLRLARRLLRRRASSATSTRAAKAARARRPACAIAIICRRLRPDRRLLRSGAPRFARSWASSPPACWSAGGGASRTAAASPRRCSSSPRSSSSRRRRRSWSLLGLALLLAVAARRRSSTALTLAVVGLPPLWICNHARDGWFWTYIFLLHRKHDFFPRARLSRHARPPRAASSARRSLLVPWALVAPPHAGAASTPCFIGLAGIVAACLGFGTQWAFTNAYIPGVLLPAIAIGVAAGRLVDATERRRRACARAVV